MNAMTRPRIRAAAAVVVLTCAGSLLTVPSAGAVSNGCWQSTTIQSPKAAAGNTIGTGRTQGKWCVLGVVGNATRLGGWAETSTPGWTASGLQASGSGVAGGEGRSYSKYKLTLGTTWLTVQEITLCPRVRGTVNATNNADSACSLF